MTKDICPRCGAVAQPGAATCATCGAWLAEAPSTDQPAASVSPGVPPPPETPVPSPAPVYQSGLTGSATTAAPPAPTYPAYPAYPAYSGYPSAPITPPATGAQAPAPYPVYPGYPTYPNYSAYPATYGYYGYYGYAPMYPAPRPRRAPGEIYALVIAWIVTALSAVSIIGGLLVAALATLGMVNGQGDDLSFLGGVSAYTIAPLLAGGVGLWYGIGGIRRVKSPRFTLPPAWVMFGLAALAIVGAFALWQVNFSLNRAPGAALAVLPLAILTGVLPALAVLTFTTQRLGDPSTRRHVWMSLFYGMTLAPLLAVIFEGILSLIIIAALGLTGQDAQAILGQPQSGNYPPQVALAIFLMLSVVAPLVEEGVKPLGALLAIRRLRTPAEAFLVGLAAGVGFDMVETIGYIGQGQADWITIAVERVGAGLLHGVGAGMATLGWYYLINGQGVRLRWLRALGCGLYAVMQHSVFNGFSLIGQVLPSSMTDWLNQPLYVSQLPLQRMDIIYLGIYLLIFFILIVVTGKLRNAPGMPEPTPPTPTWPSGPYYSYPYGPWAYNPYGGFGYGAGYGAYQPAPAPAPASAGVLAPPQSTGDAR